MKTIPVEQLDERLSEAIEKQDEHEAIGLTKDDDTVAWLLRVPKALRDSGADIVLFAEGPAGRVFVVVQAKHHARAGDENGAPTPVFGAGRGSLSVISEDDEHLKDFREYMG